MNLLNTAEERGVGGNFSVLLISSGLPGETKMPAFKTSPLLKECSNKILNDFRACV